MELRNLAPSLRTGDLLFFTETNLLSRIVRMVLRSPWSHVAMVVRAPGVEKPLLWQAVRTTSLLDVFFRRRQSGSQVDPLHEVWKLVQSAGRVAGGARQLTPELTEEQEHAVHEFIHDNYGRGFPTLEAMFGEWVEGKFGVASPTQTFFCAELVAATYQATGLLPSRPPTNWYTPGWFATEQLELEGGPQLGKLILFEPPPVQAPEPA